MKQHRDAAVRGYAELCLQGRPGACDGIERALGRPVTRASYGPIDLGTPACALLPEGFRYYADCVCKHAVSLTRPSETQPVMVPHCVEVKP